MPTRLVHIAVDAAEPSRLAQFWASALGWQMDSDGDEVGNAMPVGYVYPDPIALPLVFLRVPEPKSTKNRVHLNLATESPAHQEGEVRRLMGLGATPVEIGQGDVPWRVLADPEGNEFCVLEPRPVYRDTGPVAAVVVDCVDVEATARFWTKAAGWTQRSHTDGPVLLRSPLNVGPFLELRRVPGTKTVKNRVHLDVAPEKGEEQSDAVAALRRAGARPVDIGQRDVPWEVLADPEGNELCVLTPQ